MEFEPASNPENAYTTCVHRFGSKFSKLNCPLFGRYTAHVEI